MEPKATIILILLASALFAGCLSGKTNIPVTDTVFDVRDLDDRITEAGI